MSWSAAEANGLTISTYNVEFRAGSGSWKTFRHDSPPTATSVVVTGLTPGTAYSFRVSAVNSLGTGPTSASDQFSTLRLPGTPAKPVIGARTMNSVVLSWSAAATNGSAITNYRVEHRAGSGAWVTFARNALTATTAKVTGLTKGVSYTFRVTALSSAGWGFASPVSASALTAVAPGVPGGLSVTSKSSGQLSVKWAAAASNGAPAVSYAVSWSSGKSSRTVSTSGLAYTFTGLQPGTYAVKVTATTVEGSTSATKSGITLKP